MGSFSIWHWLVIIGWLLPMLPISRILRKAGFSPWWALLYLVPMANVAALFIFAYARWPALGTTPPEV